MALIHQLGQLMLAEYSSQTSKGVLLIEMGPTNFISQLQLVSSVAQSCPTLCDPMNRSTPGLPVHHKFLELTFR